MGSRPHNEVWADTLPGVRAISARQASTAAELKRIAAGPDQSLISAVDRAQVWASTAWRFVLGRSADVAPKDLDA